MINKCDDVKRVDKPWGYELWWALTDNYASKILHINKGESLSYQYHKFKDETIYLYSGEMIIEIQKPQGKVERATMTSGHSIRIEPFTKHRLNAVEECEVIEVSTPELEDVVRLEDKYGRLP